MENRDQRVPRPGTGLDHQNQTKRAEEQHRPDSAGPEPESKCLVAQRSMDIKLPDLSETKPDQQHGPDSAGSDSDGPEPKSEPRSKSLITRTNSNHNPLSNCKETELEQHRPDSDPKPKTLIKRTRSMDIKPPDFRETEPEPQQKMGSAGLSPGSGPGSLVQNKTSTDLEDLKEIKLNLYHLPWAGPLRIPRPGDLILVEKLQKDVLEIELGPFLERVLLHPFEQQPEWSYSSL
ncbi:uncharacterized protein LOC106530780 [Austrofundulus limnaeus]|uniref:Uncharacterized protein LOC106530780 n=1 Tax=Austrofundulus limnaeus TaxID=52670 RepID=A0A2I4CPM1_AUSLI|nr:PREDICTED: uncharacterized protein LOC106530780 [Austrofundulus limnaeus]